MCLEICECVQLMEDISFQQCLGVASTPMMMMRKEWKV